MWNTSGHDVLYGHFPLALEYATRRHQRSLPTSERGTTTPTRLRTRRHEAPPPQDSVRPLLPRHPKAVGDAISGGAGLHRPGHQRYSGTIIPDADAIWQLADAAAPCLTGHERTMSFLELGCGEYHLAAERILAVVVGEGFALPSGLLMTLTTWLDRHGAMQRTYSA
jgi:hypothetical protein